MAIQVAVRHPDTLSQEQQRLLLQNAVEAHYQALRSRPDVRTRRTGAGEYILSRLPGDTPAQKKKARIALLKEMGVPTATWMRFAAGATVPTEGLMERFVSALSLSPDEEAHLRELTVKDLFPVTAELNRALHECIRNWVENDLLEYVLAAVNAAPDHGARFAEDFRSAMTALDSEKLSPPVRRHLRLLAKPYEGEIMNPTEKQWFEAHAGISPTALSPVLRGEGVTSQSTLLKLTAAFSMTEAEAEIFLRLAGSNFTLRRDLVFLACLKCGLVRVDELYWFLNLYTNEISEAYEKPYQNLYTEDQVAVFCTANYGFLPESAV